MFLVQHFGSFGSNQYDHEYQLPSLCCISMVEEEEEEDESTVLEATLATAQLELSLRWG